MLRILSYDFNVLPGPRNIAAKDDIRLYHSGDLLGMDG